MKDLVYGMTGKWRCRKHPNTTYSGPHPETCPEIVGKTWEECDTCHQKNPPPMDTIYNTHTLKNGQPGVWCGGKVETKWNECGEKLELIEDNS